MKTFDAYLLGRFLSVFCMLFVSTFGLYVVIDGFTNTDEFQGDQQSAVDVLLAMVVYYGFQSILFFDMVGSILSVVAIMVVFALLYRHSEIHPILAAGIPVYRLLLPVLAGTMVVSGATTINQELIIPGISHRLQAPRRQTDDKLQYVEQINDYETGILISGKGVRLPSRQLAMARFILPVPEIADALTPLRASEASFYDRDGDRPAGWLLKDVSPTFEELNLTDRGLECVIPTNNPRDVFVATEVSFDQLYNRSRSYKFVSTPELIGRIKSPAYSIVSIRGQMLNLHARLTRPLMDIFAVLVAVPLILRKESRGLVGNMATCGFVLGVLYLIAQVSVYLGSVNLIEADLAAWIPVILAGTLGAWLSGVIQT